jgi:DNA (cytosine-5)-methyltransferase 1
VDVLIAGVPCQGFSLNNKKRDPNDPRNYIFMEFIRFLKLLKPRMVMLENVSGMKSTANGFFVKGIEESITSAGNSIGKEYCVKHRMLNAADYGVPQNRQRLIFIAGDERWDVQFPKKEFGTEDIPYRNVRDAIGDLPSLSAGEKKYQYDKKPNGAYQEMMRSNTDCCIITKPPIIPNQQLIRLHPQSRANRCIHDTSNAFVFCGTVLVQLRYVEAYGRNSSLATPQIPAA